MATILNLETSTNVCSVALGKNGKLIDLREEREGRSHAALLTVFIEDILDKNNLSTKDLDAISVSKGPGSYTGLRIGVSAAKGIAFGSSIPLIGISTLQSMALGILETSGFSLIIKKYKINLLCPMIDARRMEVYAAFFTLDNKIYREVSADIIQSGTYHDILQQKVVLFFGNGSEKCKKALNHSNAFFHDNFEASAAYMITLSDKAYRESRFEDVAYFEPFYLKDFIATTPGNKVIPRK